MFLQRHVGKNRRMVGKGKIIIRRIALEAADEIRRGVLDQDVVDGLLERRFFIGLIAVAKAVVVAPVRVGIFRGDVAKPRASALRITGSV